MGAVALDVRSELGRLPRFERTKLGVVGEWVREHWIPFGPHAKRLLRTIRPPDPPPDAAGARRWAYGFPARARSASAVCASAG
ncbi:hypothetical protein GCM10027290_44830 [Micromonospora sonneratiae]